MKMIHLLAFTTFLTINSASINAEPNLKDLEKLLHQLTSNDSVPGISIAIANSDGVIYAKGFGYANIENQQKMQPKTQLRIGSISKVITTAALMRMVEDNKIDLAQPISQIVTEWPDKHPEINLYNLTGHSSGIRHYRGDEFLSIIHYPSQTKSLDIFKNDPLEFNPGTQFRYSTYAWTLIAATMEKADQTRNFKDLMQTYVFNPLKLTDTQLEDSQIPNSTYDFAYTFESNSLSQSPFVDNSYKYAGGGMLSTPTDVVTFAMAHTKPGFLKERTLKKIFTHQIFNDGTPNKYGIGWRVSFDPLIKHMEKYPVSFKTELPLAKRHRNSVFHSGGSMGSSSMLILCLEHNHAVSIIKNVDGDNKADLLSLSLQALDASLG